MKATLTIIRGGEPSAMVAFEDEVSHDHMCWIRDEFKHWWDTGGVFLVQGVDLSVVDISLDITPSGVTIIPKS